MKKIKLNNNSKKKSYKKSIFKLFLFVLLIYISYSLTFNYLNKKNIDVRDKKYVDYLLENSYNNKNSKILLEEGIKLVSNINLKDPKTLLDSKIKMKWFMKKIKQLLMMIMIIMFILKLHHM